MPLSCPNHDGKAYVGCVAVAVGQIMAYHKKPTTFQGKEMHWYDMTSSPRSSLSIDGIKDIQHLLYRLGTDFLDMTYGFDGSGATNKKALDAFKSNGYTDSRIIHYNAPEVVKQLRQNRPVYIRGLDNSSGHAWLIDGYMHRSATETISVICYPKVTTYKETVTKTYHHHNLGWNGIDSGWYLEGIFDTNKGPGTFSRGTLPDDRDYSRNNRLIINIK